MLNKISFDLTDNDLNFIINTAAPNASSKEELKKLILEDESFREGIIGSDKLFSEIVDSIEIMTMVSPRLIFEIFLRRTKKEFERRTWTFEKIGSQKAAVFDLAEASYFLGDTNILYYLANMLSSFTKIESFTLPVRVRKGIWHKIRFNDMDIDSLARILQIADSNSKFYFIKRIADVSLFIMGVFPEYVMFDYRYPYSGELRPKIVGRIRRSAEEYEETATKYYKLAASEEKAYALNMDEVFLKLSQNFSLARKTLDFITQHYLHISKHSFFSL
jgi:hypothetical protein